MLVSCILPTFNRRRFIPQAIACFLAQDFVERELIVVDDGTDPIRDLIPTDPRIHYLRQEKRLPVGRKRNLACEAARGELIVHWDDDDWSAPWRLSYQADQLRSSNADLSGLDRVFFYAPEENRAWEYVYEPAHRPWVYGASLCYTREFWKQHPFPEINIGEDNRFVWNAARPRIHRSEDPRFLVAVIHGSNTSRKQTADRRYRPQDVTAIENLLGDAKLFYRSLRKKQEPTEPSLPKPCALVAAALGIGDILRVTPLVRAVSRLGYDVDVLLSTDYPETATLLEGVPEVRAVVSIPSGRRTRENEKRVSAPGELPSCFRETEYDLALSTTWGAKSLMGVRAKRTLTFDRKTWLSEGDFRSGERLARELGWKGELPPPFAAASKRRFNLLPGTVALHPGCKAEWPWKKWHGFSELAELFPRVVIVGTPEDLRVDGTYFNKNYTWPAHAQSFVGQLNLADTAALLSECTAVVSNDSGIMHLATALGRPTFGIFGITSPQREGLPTANFHPITKGLSCEAACRRGAWGRRDCVHHLACLKTLSPQEVFMRVSEAIPSVRTSHRGDVVDLDPALAAAPEVKAVPTDSPPHTALPHPCETIDLVYYGYVFDASGYGNAARGYLHALHTAGIRLAVVDLANHGRQVSDPLIESLVGQRIEGDFHLFHGIPPQWARKAFPLNHVIGMTVWETDAMPSSWRPALSHATEVWLPCDYNVNVFAKSLQRPIFKLPHAWNPKPINPDNACLARCGIRAREFVFYSIFEWQERKGPAELIEAFLRAFPNRDDPVVLVVKTNPGAAGIAQQTLTGLRQRITSAARVELRCEAWSEEQIAALQVRGECYVSLHHGEGWNYPLFEAAAAGKSVVATGFSGPLEYLDPSVHQLVRHREAPVRQRYAYYSTAMHWAEPDISHAVECLKKARAEHLSSNAARAGCGQRIQAEYSLASIGQTARRRLYDLLRTANPGKWQRMELAARRAIRRPAVPISGDWYDADYFEHGRKSNWTDGYRWDLFGGLFREAAEFLIQSFSGSRSFLDAGCAKGFLVKALREQDRDAWGFDHSRWAIEHAESSAKPFIERASAECVSLKNNYDVLVAFDLLQSLDETQALAFLERARPHIRHALLAVIPLRAENAEAELADQDLARVTRQTRAWWHAHFQRAGWNQDPVHALAERMLNQHALPTRMGWQIFLYAPQ